MAETAIKNPKGPRDSFNPAGLTANPRERKKRTKAASEYKKSLVEKQSLKQLYGLSEKQMKRYVAETTEMIHAGNLSDELMKRLERRLDSVVLRMGFAKSKPHARQMISHAYFLVNGKQVNIPSFQVSIGDIVTVKENKKNKQVMKDLAEVLKKLEVSSWVNVDKVKLEGKFLKYPSLADINPPVELQLIFEFYSR